MVNKDTSFHFEIGFKFSLLQKISCVAICKIFLLMYRLDISILLSQKKFTGNGTSSSATGVQNYEITDVDYEKVCLFLFFVF